MGDCAVQSGRRQGLRPFEGDVSPDRGPYLHARTNPALAEWRGQLCGDARELGRVFEPRQNYGAGVNDVRRIALSTQATKASTTHKKREAPSETGPLSLFA